MRLIRVNDGRSRTFFFSGDKIIFENSLRPNSCKSARDRITRLFGDNSGKTVDGKRAGNQFELLRQRKYDDDTGRVSRESKAKYNYIRLPVPGSGKYRYARN